MFCVSIDFELLCSSNFNSQGQLGMEQIEMHGDMMILTKQWYHTCDEGALKQPHEWLQVAEAAAACAVHRRRHHFNAIKHGFASLHRRRTWHIQV